MHHSLKLLDEVVKLAQEEFRLIELEDAAGLAESAERRGGLIREAWESKLGCDELDFVTRLMSIQDLQHRLSELAEKKLAETRDILNGAKKSRQAVLQYCRAGVGAGKRPPRMVAKFS